MDDDLKNAFDCAECALKHVAKARCQVAEYRQDPIYKLELVNAIGNLGCAEDHLLERYPMVATLVRECRLSIENRDFNLAPIDYAAMLIANLTELFGAPGQEKA